MGYFLTIGLVVFLLVHSISEVTCISPRRDVEDHVRSSRAHTNEPPITDWEIGLREAAHQALLREGYANPSLRDYLQSAPFSGKQNAKVFGDIAVLARGQLYATPVGFTFVQDPYQNDCDECHNERKCRGDKCDHFIPYGAQQLVALWTVKRIRHRDINFGYRYEVEYTISPVEKALKEGFITRNGKFDYGIPGHVFVIKSNPRHVNGYEHNEFYSSPDQVKWHRQYVPRPPNEIYPQVLITHAHPPPLINTHTNRPPADDQYETNAHDKNLKEIQLYRNLINSLSAKTSTTGHRFKIDATSTSPKTTINRIIPSATPTRPITPGKTTLVQLPSGQIVPATEVSTSTTPDGQFQILTPVGAPQNVDSSTSQIHLIPSSPITVTEVTKYHTEASIPNQIPSTKVPIFIMRELIPPSSPSYRPEVVKDMGSTKLPKKTTIHFFAAEDVDKSGQEEKGLNDIFSISSKKYPTRKQFTESSQRTTKTYDDDEDSLNLFPAVKPTDAMRKFTEAPLRKTSPNNNQISRPYKETQTTQSLSSATNKEQTMFGRRTTIPFSYATTETPFIYGTQRTTITLPMPRTPDQRTTLGTAYTFQSTPTHPTKGSKSYYDYNDKNTPEPNETIITVTPIPTAPVGQSTPDESTTTFYDYFQGRLTTVGNVEHTTEKMEQSTVNDPSKITLVFPSTLDDTTVSSKATDIGITKEHIYYAGISTTEAYTESAPTTEKSFNTPSTIVTYYSPQITEHHNLAYPSTESMPVHSTTSPSIETTTAIFKSTKATRLATTKLKPTTTKTTSNDFLVEEISDEDDSVAVSRNKSKFQDYTDDDIFGPAEPKQKEKKVSSYKRQPSRIYKTGFTTEPTRTVAKTPRIIYSDFFEASTVPPTTSLTQFYAESQNNYITHSLDATTPHIPLTSQSYLTSISYKVNKKKTSTPGELEVLPTIRAKLSNLHNDEKLQIFRAELPEIEETATKKSPEKEAFDNIALQLVNHARSLELLNRKPTVENKNPVQEKKNTKYRRRSYMPKSRKNLKGKNKREK